MEKANPHSIFVGLEDKFSWEKYLEQLPLIELSPSERERASNAISFLRKLLGESFLMRGSYSAHPFFRELLNSAPMARLRIIRFAEAIQAMLDAEGFEDVKRRLRKAETPDGFLEGASLVSLAHQFQQAGFEICFEPKVRIKSSTRKETANFTLPWVANTRTFRTMFKKLFLIILLS